jgi:hypothetical protein
MSDSPITCTVGPSAVTGERCGKPAVTTFVGRNGEIFAECADHAPASLATSGMVESAPLAHPPTRTTKPFVLVRNGAIVGYAESASPAVEKRAARLGAKIVKVVR